MPRATRKPTTETALLPTAAEVHELKLTNLHLQALLCDKDLEIANLRRQIAESNAASVEAEFRKLLMPPADHLFHWGQRQFVAPTPVPVPTPPPVPAQPTADGKE